MGNPSKFLNSSSPWNDLTGQKPGNRLCIYIGESDRWRGKPLDMAILETLRSQGLAGATVYRGTSGFGAHSHIRTSSIEVLSVDLPVLIEVVDLPERIQRGLEMISPMVTEGLITLEDVTIVKYTHRFMNPLPADRLAVEVMTKDVVSLREDMTLRDAWEMMIHNALKALPVVDASSVVTGILTDEDMLERGGIKQRLSIALQMDDSSIRDELRLLDESGRQVKDVMTHPVITVKKDESLGLAVSKLVKAGLKRLPVVDEKGRLAGMLSRLDILRQVADSPFHLTPSQALPTAGRVVKVILRTDIPTVRPNESLSSILEKFVQSDTHRLVVIDEKGSAIGMIADSDVVSRVQPEQRRGILDALRNMGKPPVEKISALEIMSPGVTAIQTNTAIADAARLMLKENRKWLVVVDDNNMPVGLVDRRKILESLSSKL